MSEYNETKKKSELQYAKDSLKRVPLDIQKDYFQNILKPSADWVRMPVNTFIKTAINRYIEDLSDKGVLSDEISDNFQKFMLDNSKKM